MKYSGEALGCAAELSIEREGLRIGAKFIDFADFVSIRPKSHRVYIQTSSDGEIEVSMLGFSYDGFLEELTQCFTDRGMEALFAEEEPIMRCEGEYAFSQEKGRGIIFLLPDAICVLPLNCRSIRIPLCFTREIKLDGYLMTVTMQSGAEYTVGRMGYDTKPFAERAQKAAENTKSKRKKALSALKPEAPFTHCGLFRTEQPELYWTAAFGDGRCAIELFTNDDSATYLYSFSEQHEEFTQNAEEALEAMGVHREIIYLSDEQLEEKPLYRMSVARSEAVRFLRERSCGRLIHNESHSKRLRDFLDGKY